MTLHRLAVLQWVGLVLGGAIFAAQFAVGFGVTQAECNAGGAHWGISNDVWEGTLLGVAVALVLAAQACSVAVVLGTRRESYEDPPPPGRIRFLAIAAVPANVIFLMIILLDGFASMFDVACRQA